MFSLIYSPRIDVTPDPPVITNIIEEKQIEQVPDPVFKQTYKIQFEAEQPEYLCCHFYGSEKVEGNIYEACLDERADNKMKVAKDFDFYEKFHYFTCGVKVKQQLCRIVEEKDKESEEKI